MKKALLLGTVLCISLGITACTKSNKEQKEESKANQGEVGYITEDGKVLTEEELRILDEEYNKELDENVKYKFGKVSNIQEGKVEVILTNTPQGYRDRGYNEDLNVDTSKLKETGESMSFDLIGTGINTNIDIGNIDEVNNVKYVRIGIYEPEKESGIIGLEKGKVLTVDKIN